MCAATSNDFATWTDLGSADEPRTLVSTFVLTSFRLPTSFRLLTSLRLLTSFLRAESGSAVPVNNLRHSRSLRRYDHQEGNQRTSHHLLHLYAHRTARRCRARGGGNGDAIHGYALHVVLFTVTSCTRQNGELTSCDSLYRGRRRILDQVKFRCGW